MSDRTRTALSALLAAAWSIAGATSGAWPAQAETVSFAPHRAVYEITLARSTAGSGVSDMTGRMVYELTGSACEGFTQNMRFVTRSSNSEGAETINDLRTSSWEETAGKRLRFSSTQYQNDVIAEASQGDASRDKAASSDAVDAAANPPTNPAVSVDLARPAKKQVKLPTGVYFPMQHAIALIDAARGGKTLVSANLYDGSEKGEKYYATTAVIGKKVEPGAVANAASLKSAARLAGIASWPMTISYFDTGKDKQDSLPAYELSFRYFENGVTNDLKIDYGEFALQGEMKELELLPASKCNAAP
ncbi:MAG: cell envelope integrity EipB family protein [Hyphomicrobium sp.]